MAVVASFAGVSKSTWHEWQTRKGVDTKHNHDTPKLNWYTPEEKKAVVNYVLTHKNFLYGLSYIKVLGVFYYFISIMDGYSRKVLDWELCETMEGINIELLVARVKAIRNRTGNLKDFIRH